MIKYVFSLILMGAFACSTQFTEPQVNMVDLRFLETTFFESRLETTIRIINANNENLTITGSSHKLKINDLDLGIAQSNRRINVPALGEATDMLNIRVSNLKLLTKMEDLIKSKNFSYEIDSVFYTTRSLGLGTIRLKTSGQM